MSRYSQLYIERGRAETDSQRARVRLYAALYPKWTGFHDIMEQRIAQELGVSVRTFDKFYKEASIRDALDSVTEIAEVLKEKFTDGFFVQEWLIKANRIFVEENLAYRVGKDGIVHPYPDAEFEVNTASALAALDEPRFAASRNEFEAALRHLRNEESKEALRTMFPAVETAAKVLFPGKFAGLSASEVDKFVRPVLERRYAGNEQALNAGRLLLSGMKAWINAAHQYRHGPEIQVPAEPPLDFVIAHLSIGATYLRWMVELCSVEPA